MKTIDATQLQDDPLQWTVTVNYDSDVPDPEEQEENPLNRPATWKFTFSRYTKAVQKDLLDQPIVNSAGQPFEPPVEIDMSRPVINVTINKATFSYAYIATLQDAVNSDAWFGFMPGQLKMAGVEAESQFENNIAYWRLSYTIEVNWEGWNPLRVLDAGYYEKDPGASGSGSNELRLLRDAFGSPLSSPSLLDGFGHKLPDGMDPVYLPFQVYRYLSFAGVP